MNNKIAVLGSSDFVMPFSALGVDTFATTDKPDSVTENAKSILESKYALVVVAENIARQADEVLKSAAQKTLPCVVVVPFTTEPTGYAIQSLGQALKMAMGIDIFKKH